MIPPFETSSTLDASPRIAHGFFGREGGVSTGLYASLNVSEKGGDDPGLTARNRALAAEGLGFSADSLTTLNQVHSNRVIVLTEPQATDARPEADAIVTNLAGIPLGILTADCVPILLADPYAGVVGAAHAGWKGAVDDIAYATVMAMVALGADPANMVTAIGPSISLGNYEVGPEFAANVLARHAYAAEHFTKPDGGKEHFDLPGFIATQLRGAGIGTVEQIGSCTYAQPARYFSHRFATHQGTTTGRQISIIALR